ncbi:hypothetical protein [Bacillus sp. JCM 19034]|uniref:hypothetical protein n=1 Tax=Bacillus sp. JCM 19034 TaxID=1481928 RepID=UPI000780ECB9|nr:hypothetical protein [Bacillus sp. JCM 19034]
MSEQNNDQKPLEDEEKHSTSTKTQVKKAQGENTSNDETVNSTHSKQNVYLDQSKEISKQYFSFALSVLKQPFHYSATLGQKQMVNGLISMILYSLLLPMYIYIIGYSLPFFDTVLKPAFATMILFLLLSVIILGVTKLMKIETNFKTIVTRFGSFITISTILLVVANILALLSIITFSILLISCALLGYFIAIATTMFSFHEKDRKGIDTFYAIAIIYIAIGFISYLVGESMVNQLLNLNYLF